MCALAVQQYKWDKERALGRARLIFVTRTWFHRLMKADLRISIKDYRRNKSLKVLLFRAPWPRQFFVRMNGERWPAGKGTASLSRVFAAL